MKADPFAQLKLLDVQELDTRLDTLRHQLDTMPEARQLQELSLRRRQVDNAVRDLRIQSDDLTTEQKRADADVESVKARRARDQAMVDSGSIKDPKALQRMLGELESLDRRIGDLEDVEIEVMERLEAVQERLQAGLSETEQLDRQLADLEQDREKKAGDLQNEAEQATAERSAAAAGLPTDLGTLYEKLRAQKDGIGAAPLRRRECGGCRLTLNAADLSAIAKAPSDEVVRCEECGRILVRTGESGL